MANALLEKVKGGLSRLPIKRVANFVTSLAFGSKDILGVDIGSHSIKVASVEDEGQGTNLVHWGHLPLDLGPEATPEERKEKAVHALKAFMVSKGVGVRNVATSVSGNAVIVRYVKLPLLTKEELRATLATEAEPFIPFDINDVQLGFHILGEVMEEGQRKMETILVAAKRDVIQGRVEILEGAGLVPAIIDVDSFALENIYGRLRPQKAEGAGGILYLNIGHQVTNLSILEGEVTRVVRDVFISGITFTKAIAKALGCETAKAEELKIAHPILVDPQEKEKALQEGNREALGVSQAASQVGRDLVGEVHRSVDFYLSQGPERSIAGVVLSGGGSKLKNLAAYLNAELRVPVEGMDPLGFLSKIPSDLPPEVRADMAVAVGLALRRNRDWL